MSNEMISFQNGCIQKYKPNKRIFIRTVSMISNGTEVRRVPTEEVLEIIPLVLKQQGCPIFNSNGGY